MALKQTTKESIKTALAVTLSLGIALYMDWDKPMWAAFSAAFVSLGSYGASMNKAAMRMLGTLAGAVGATIIIALFIQNRWAFMASLSVWIGVCTYLMSVSARPYFWNITALVAAIICFSTPPDAEDIFLIIIERTEETGLGILCYGLVAALVWPASSYPLFKQTGINLVQTQEQILHYCFNQIMHKKSDIEINTLLGSETQLRSQFNQLLSAAETESYKMKQLRPYWQALHNTDAQISQTLSFLRESLAELETLDLPTLFPNLQELGDELCWRLGESISIMEHQISAREPISIRPELNQQAIEQLTYFDKAAILVTHRRMKQLDGLSRDLLSQAKAIAGIDQAPNSAYVAKDYAAPAAPALNLDGMFAAGRVMLTLWLAFLAVLYIDALPGGSGLLSMTAPFAIITATTPQLRVSQLLKPALISVALAAPFHLLIMPRIDSFLLLGPIIFLVIFGICYRFSAPQQAMGRLLGMAMFISVAALTNTQSYSFLAVVNTALILFIVFMLIGMVAYLSYSSRAERSVERITRRFFGNCAALGAALVSPTDEKAKEKNWISRRHEHDVANLPAKLNAWSRLINPQKLPGSSPQQVQALSSRLQAISYRLRDLLALHEEFKPTNNSGELAASMAQWRSSAINTFNRFANNPDPGDQKAIERGMKSYMEAVEIDIHLMLNNAPTELLTLENKQKFYNLLGAYRGLSAAMVNYENLSRQINWVQWREERFS